MDEPKSANQSVASTNVLDLVKNIYLDPKRHAEFVILIPLVVGGLILFVHILKIRYMPEFTVTDIVAVTFVLFLTGIFLVIALSFVMITPSLLWVLSNKMLDIKTLDHKNENKDKIKAEEGKIISVFGLNSLLILIFYFLAYQAKSEIYYYVALVLPPIISLLIGKALYMYKEKRINAIENSSPKEKKEKLTAIWTYLLKGVSLLIISISVWIAIKLVQGDENIDNYDFAVTGTLVMLLVTFVNIFLVIGFNREKKTAKLFLYGAIFFGLFFVVLTRLSVVDVTVSLLGLGKIEGAKLWIQPGMHGLVQNRGFKCDRTVRKNKNEECIIDAYLVTRIGSNYVLLSPGLFEKYRADKNAYSHDVFNLKNYLILPKTSAMLMPTVNEQKNKKVSP